MARTTGRSGFKMKSSPTKGKLGDFFSSLGKQLKRNNRHHDIDMDLKEKYRGQKQTTNKAGEKIGYKNLDRATIEKHGYDTDHNASVTGTQQGRAKQVALGNTDTKNQASAKVKNSAKNVVNKDKNKKTTTKKTTKKETFGQAFKNARKKHGGDGGTFTYEGKKYTTDIKKKK